MTESAEPAPYPAAVKPTARPRRSGNHLTAWPTQVAYIAPPPVPPTTAPTYSISSDCAYALMIQPRATRIPPHATTSLGPLRAPRVSTIQPSIGVSQVSSAMKMLNATWIDASDQPCALLIGLTNSVQPYCRLAINTMHRMQRISWVQRVAGVATAPDSTVVVALVIVFRP